MTEAGRRHTDWYAMHGDPLLVAEHDGDILAIEAEARAEPPALDVERLERAYANTEERIRNHVTSEPFWSLFAAEYARLAREGSDG